MSIICRVALVILWLGLAGANTRSTPPVEVPVDTTITALQNRVNILLEDSTPILDRVAEVQALTRSLEKSGVHPNDAKEWALLFHHYGTKVGVDPRLLAAMAYHESGFKRTAYNPDDPSYGLMQVMPYFWRNSFIRECGDQATEETLYDPQIAICYGAHIAAFYKSQHPDNERAGIVAYNNGSGRYNGYARMVYRALELL